MLNCHVHRTFTYVLILGVSGFIINSFLGLDGYSAPITAGNFVKNILDGKYNDCEIAVDQNGYYFNPKNSVSPQSQGSAAA